MKRCLWMLALLFACANEDDRSTLTLTITSSLRVPDEIDRVTVRVTGQEPGEDPSADLSEHPLPRTLTLVHEGGPLGPVPVSVRGWLGPNLVITQNLSPSFPQSGNTDLTVTLDRSCKSVSCGQDETCEQGRCVPILGEDAGVDAALPQRDATVREDAQPGQDATVQDAAHEEDATQDGGMAPTCTIALPVTGDAYQVGVPFPLQGTCSDPETGALSALTWLSSLDGALGSGASVQAQLTTAGAHRVTLCAPDPDDATLVGCASTDISATTTPQPTASIASITQGNLVASPYRAGAALSYNGVGSGAGVTLSWSDDLHGALGSGSSVALAAPFVGRHTVTLTVQDRNGAQRMATQSYVVFGAGETGLVSPLATVNSELDRAGDLGVSSIASDPQSRAYVPSSSEVWYRFDGNALSAAASVAVGQPPLADVVQDAQITAGASYLATHDGLAVCAFTPAAGAGEPCTNYRSGGLLTSQNNFLSVLRMVDSRSVDTLMVGSDNGLFLSSSVNGSLRGSFILRGRVVSDMVAISGQAALALDNGLTLLTPSNQRQVRFTTSEGLPHNNLRSLAVAVDNTLWIASAGGLAHFEPGTNRITKWTTMQGLPSNDCRGVAVQHVNELAPPRDVVWVATSAGVARLDTATNQLTTFVEDDGLPDKNVLAVHVLANGIKLFGTQKGLAHYVGF